MKKAKAAGTLLEKHWKKLKALEKAFGWDLV